MILADLTELEREEYEERAGIIEFCGNVPRAQAERQALELIAHRVRDLEAAVIPRRKGGAARRKPR